MRSAEHFNNIGINQREEGESRADAGSGEVHEASVSGGGLHRVHRAMGGDSSPTDWASPVQDYTPAERHLIEDFHRDGFGGSGELPQGLA